MRFAYWKRNPAPLLWGLILLIVNSSSQSDYWKKESIQALFLYTRKVLGVWRSPTRIFVENSC